MKIAIALCLIVIGFVLGFAMAEFSVLRSERSLELARSVNDVDLFTRLLDGLRGNQEDLMKDRLETLLDYSIIHVSREYSPNLDHGAHAAKALALARSYRAAHPHRSQMDDIAKKVDAAFTIAIKP